MSARIVAWRRTGEGEGHSLAWVERRPGGGWFTDAQEILVGRATIGCRFSVGLDAAWRTEWVLVQSASADAVRMLELKVVAGRRWFNGHDELPELHGCIDVDVAATPLTNTFPIRRYADLAVGESRTAPVAWIEVPTLHVERVEQTYRRVGPREWEYGDAKHGAWRITVDEDGLVRDYEGFAERVAG